MEHNILVGGIVGLALASSIYIWNNEKFNTTQRTVLLIFILFPPAQWIGILIVLIYNSNIENNTPERKIEKKLDSTISNLTDLKNKGILTDTEYKNKVEKINIEKSEQNLKGFLEYKQLKSLLDNGILTKEEFESKVQKLNDSIAVTKKNIDLDELQRLQDYVEKLKSMNK